MVRLARAAAMVVEGLEGRVLFAEYGELFAGPVNFPTGWGPVSMAAADVDGDGDLDLITADYMSNDIAVLRNNGRGLFGAPVQYDGGPFPHSLVAADIDGDGDTDIAVANHWDRGISVLLNRGNGTFARRVSYGLSVDFISIAAADVNQDGYMDLVGADYCGKHVSVLINQGDQTFSGPVRYDTGISTFGIAAFDANRDGWIDLVTGNDIGSGIAVLLGNSGGTFGEAQSYGLGDEGRVVSVASADVDGDGDIDVVTANEDRDDVTLFRNSGHGTFGVPEHYSAGAYPSSVVAADVDSDGRVDLVTANGWSAFTGHGEPVDDISVLRNYGNGTFALPDRYPANFAWTVIAADLDRDGDMDLVGGMQGNTSIAVLRNNVVANKLLTDLTLSAATLAENQPVGTVVGTVGVKEPWAVQSYTATLVSGTGSRDNGCFEIVGNELRTAAEFDYEDKHSYQIRVRVTDQDGLWREKAFTIKVTDVTETTGPFGWVNGKSRTLVIEDTDGDRVRFSLKGGGSGVLQSDGRLTLTNTTADSVLSIRVRRHGDGVGTYLLSGISCDGLLKRISAPHVDVFGPMELNTSRVAVGTSTTTIRLGMIRFASLNTHGVPIHSLTVLDWQDPSSNDVVTAPWIGSIVVLGGVPNQLDFGCWGANVVTTSSNHGVAIGSFKVADYFSDANIWASGSIGRISAKYILWGTRIAAADGIGSISTTGMIDSDVLVGVGQEFEGRFATAAADFANPAATLKRLTVSRLKWSKTETAVSNSHISAPAVGTVSLANVPANTSPILHVLRDTGTLTLKSLSPDMLSPGTWNAGQTPKPGHERPNLIDVLVD